MARRPSPDASDLAWLIGVLWGPGAEILTEPERPAGRGSTYVIAPARRWPRMLLPDDRIAARGALLGGTATRSFAARRRRGAFATALRTDTAWHMVRDRVWIPGPDPLRERLEEALGGPAMIAAALRVRAPFRKPMLQVLAPTGEVVAYAKVAWNEVTALNARAEHEALLAFADADHAGLRTPEVVAMLEHRGFPVLVTRPMPEAVARYAPSDPPPPVTVTRRISEVLSLGRAPGSIDERLRSRLDAVAVALSRDGRHGAVVDAAISLRNGLDTANLPTGAWHGDWAPWNLGRENDTLWVWDWEHWRSDVPLGLDVPHFVFQQRFVAERAPLDEAFAAAREASSEPLTSLGYGPDDRRTLDAIHVLEICLRYLEAETYGAPANPRFVAGALDALRSVQA
jgi:hypothetical protein